MPATRRLRRSTRSLAPAFALALAVAALPPAPASAQEPAPAAREAAEALVGAFSSGDPAAVERMAQARYAPALLARRTPEERRRLAERLREDFGALTITSIAQPEPTRLVVAVEGATGLAGRFEIDFEPQPPHRIAALRVEAGGLGPGDEDPGPRFPPPPVASGMSPAELAAALDPYLAKLAAEDAFSGVVLVAREGKPLYRRAYGQADRARGVPNAPETRFNLASIGKAFTKVALGQLLARGRLALDDPIGKHLPAYPNPEAARKVTVGHLLEHRGGVPDIFRHFAAAAREGRLQSNRDWMALVAGEPLEFEPGTRTRYCNGCYVVLGEVIAAVAGMPYEEYLARHVFAPAGMAGAGFLAAGEPGVALGYTRQGESGAAPGLASTEPLRRDLRGSAAGGSYATAADLLAFDNALREGRLLDRERTAWYFAEPEAGPGRARGQLQIAGGSPGASTLLAADGTWTVIVLSNLDPPAGEGLGIVLFDALAP